MEFTILNAFTFLSSLLIFLLGLFVFFKGEKSIVIRTFFRFTITIFVWLICYSLAYLFKDTSLKLLLFKGGYIGVIFIPVTWYHFTISFLHKENKKLINFLLLGYAFAIFFILLILFSNLFVTGLFKYVWNYYPKVYPPIHFIFLAYFNTYFTVSILLLFFSFWKRKDIHPIEKMKREYVFLSCLIGTLAAIDFLPNYKINYSLGFIPFGFIFMMIFCAITTYSILKYHLLDIRIAITRTGIFLFVYLFVLGLPFWFGYQTKLWSWALLLMGILTTIGPSIYNLLRNQAEKIILAEQKKYHAKLRRLSTKILEIKNLDKLLKRITWQVHRVVKVEYTSLYLYDEKEKVYLKKNSYPVSYPISHKINPQSTLTKLLFSLKRPLIEKEIDSQYSAGLVSPCFRDNSLIGFLILGKKKTKNPFTPDDTLVFELLSNQASLAIENCLFWKEEKLRLSREEQIRRQKAMDHFSASLAHEIQNPISCVIALIKGLQETITQEWQDIAQDKITYLNQRLTKVGNNLLRISKMIKAVREFSRSTEGEFNLIKMDEVVEDFLSIVEPQFRYERIIFEKDIEQGILLRGNKIHLEEVLINLATNAIHAVRHNHHSTKRISLRIHKNSPNTLLIQFKDNGYGIKEELLDDIFLDFVTTKASTEGTGMGLARVRKIILNHKGRIWAKSEGKNKGATFFVELPLIKGRKKQEEE